MKYFLLLISLTIAVHSNAQQNSEISKDTIYFKSDWEKCSKEKAEYYKTISKRDKGYQFSYFYMKSGIPYMTVISSRADTLIRNGHYTSFSPDGKKSSEGQYINDQMIGKWIFWEEGDTDSTTIQVFSDETYKNIHLSPARVTLNNNYEVLYKLEEPASFDGSEAAMQKWIASQIDRRGYPKKEMKEGISGTCYVTFVVEKDGSISDIKILRGIPKGDGYNQLAMDVVKDMPTWKPGLQYGKRVRVQFNLPIRFVVR